MLFAFTSKAQVPNLINYQAVARSSSGGILATTSISLRLSIRNLSTIGAIEYQEIQHITTNAFGLFNLHIGTGTVVTGSFSSIDWGTGDKYLQVEIDPIGGSAYVDMGAQQLVSVPYALYAANSGTSFVAGTGINISGTTISAKDSLPIWNADAIQGVNISTVTPVVGQVLTYNGTKWTPQPPTTTGTVTSITTGAGLTGGVITSTGIISMPNVGTPGVYGSSTQVPIITTDPQGRITNIVNTSILGDNWGTQNVISDSTISGNGLNTSPLKIAQQGATVGKVLKWNGLTWSPSIDSNSGGTLTSIIAGSGLSGGTITTSGTISLPFIGSPGTFGSPTQVPVISTDSHGRVTGVTTVPITGDNWGSQSVVADSTLAGAGTTSNTLKIAQNGAVSGQVLKWNGTTWRPSNDNNSGGTVTSITAGNGLLGGTIIANGTISLPYVGTPGTYGSSTQVPVFTTDSFGRVNGVTNSTISGDNWGTQSATTDITINGNGTSGSPLRIAQNGAINGQVLKWNGITWVPNNDSNTHYTAGTGITINTSNVISTNNLHGDVNGPTNATTVTKIQGDSISPAMPTMGQVLTWNDTAWVPSTLQSGWQLNGNSGTNSNINFVGTTDTSSLRFRVNNNWAGEINFNSENIFLGYMAGKTSGGGWSVGIGDSALFSTIGGGNVAVGFNSLFTDSIGGANTALGYKTMYWNKTGSYNCAIGSLALYSNTLGLNNVAMGNQALYNNTLYGNNTAIGVGALYGNTIGSNNTAIGSFADVGSGALMNATAIGSTAVVNTSNTVVIGNASVTSIGGFTSWTNLSDGRFKKDIKENVPGLAFIAKLRPVTYKFEARKYEKFIGKADSNVQKLGQSYELAESQTRTGFIAQEVEQAAKETGYDFSGVHKPLNEKDNYSLAYGEFTVPLVKAVQELNDLLQKTVAIQNQQIEDLKKEIAELKKKSDSKK